jgi:hypothetical protein
MFEVLEKIEGKNFWEVRISDDTSTTDRPIFHYTIPKKGCPFTIHELAVRGAEECAEARGLIIMREYLHNIPIFTTIYAANSRQVFCIRSSDHERAKPVDLQTGINKLKEKIKSKNDKS